MANLKVAAGLIAALAVTAWAGLAPARAESVMKECGTEWKAAKAANTTGGKTWQEFLKDCRARHETPGAAAAPAAAPAPAPAPTPTMTAAPTGAGQFATDSEAKGRCPTDNVVWVNLNSKKYHYVGNRNYGKTKRGAYMCEADAKAAGDVAAKGEKPKM